MAELPSYLQINRPLYPLLVWNVTGCLMLCDKVLLVEWVGYYFFFFYPSCDKELG